MTRPENWPFDSWFDLEELIADAATASHSNAASSSSGEDKSGEVVSTELADMIKGIASLQMDYLEFIESFLRGTELFERPTYFSRVLYGITGDLYLGAISTVADQPPGYAIGIYSGSWLQLLLCFSRLLADSTVSVSLPLMTPDGVEDVFSGSPEWPSLDMHALSDLRELTALAVRFLFLHEFSHVHLHHVDFVLLADDVDEISDLEFQCLEHLADMHATFWATQFATITGKIKAKGKDSVESGEMIRRQLWLQGFAVGTVALLLEILNRYTDSHHPTSSKRAAFLRVGPAGSPADPVGITKTDALTVLGDGYQGALEAWDRRGWYRDHAGVEAEIVDYMEVVKRVGEKIATSGARELSIRTGRQDDDS